MMQPSPMQAAPMQTSFAPANMPTTGLPLNNTVMTDPSSMISNSTLMLMTQLSSMMLQVSMMVNQTLMMLLQAQQSGASTTNVDSSESAGSEDSSS